MTAEIIARRAKIEKEWFKKEYDKQFSKPSREEKDENADLEKVIQQFRKLSKRKVCERKQFHPTVTTGSENIPVIKKSRQETRSRLSILFLLFYTLYLYMLWIYGDREMSHFQTSLHSVPRYNWWGLKEFLWKLKIMKYDKPAGSFAPRLVETAKQESLFYRSAEGQAILIERGPEFCLSGCLKFFITNRKLEKNFAAAIEEIKEQIKEVVEPEQVKIEDKTQKKPPLSDRICFQYRCTVSSQVETDTDGEFVIGDYSHLLFGSPDDNILCDIEGVELQVSSYKDEPADSCAFLSVTKTAKKLFHVEQIKERISKVKKDLITSVFEIPERFNSKESQYECTDIPEELQRKEGLCESLAEIRRRRKEKESLSKSLVRSLDTDMLMPGFSSDANKPYSSFEMKSTNSGDNNIFTSRESKSSVLIKSEPQSSYNGKDPTKESTPISSEPIKISKTSVTITESNQQELEKLHSNLRAPTAQNMWENQENIHLQDTTNKEQVDKRVANIIGKGKSVGNTPIEGELSKEVKSWENNESLNKNEEHYILEKENITEPQKYPVLSTPEIMGASHDKVIKNSITLEPPVLFKETQANKLNHSPKDEDKLITKTTSSKASTVQNTCEKQEFIQLLDKISTNKAQVHKKVANITGPDQPIVNTPIEGEPSKEVFHESLKKNKEDNISEKENITEPQTYPVTSTPEIMDASHDKVIKNATTLEPPVLLKDIQPTQGKKINPLSKDEDKLNTTTTSLKAHTVEKLCEKQENIQLQDRTSTIEKYIDEEVANITGVAQSVVNTPIEGELSKEVFHEPLKENEECYVSEKANITELQKYEVLSTPQKMGASHEKVIKNATTLKPPVLLKEIQPAQGKNLNPSPKDESKLTTTSGQKVIIPSDFKTDDQLVKKPVTNTQSTVTKELRFESKSLDEKLTKSNSEDAISQDKKNSSLLMQSKLCKKQVSVSDSNNLYTSTQKSQLPFDKNHKLDTETKEIGNEILSTGANENNKQATVTEQRSSSAFGKKIRTKLSKFSWKSLLSSHSVKRSDKSPLSINASFKRSSNTVVLDKSNDSKFFHLNLTDAEGPQIEKDIYLNRPENDEAEKGDSYISGQKSHDVIGVPSDETNTVESTTTDVLETDINKYYRFYF